MAEDLDTYNDIVKEAPDVAEQDQPSYRVFGDNKIPVSKHRGKLWKSRRDQARQQMSKVRKAWDEAIKYFHHDQSRDSEGGQDASNVSSQGMANPKETENMVFANVTAMVPMLYTKNPDAEFTAQSPETSALADTLEALIKKLAAQKASPGLNLKPKAKRAVVLTTLCNLCWFEVGYTMKDKSSDGALADLQKLSQEFVEAKSKKEIAEIEGKLLALESKIDLLSPSGPWVKLRKPWEVFVDGNTTELDLTDSNWAMIEDMMPTELLRALYATKDADSPQYRTVYEPTHILKVDGSSKEDNITGDNFVLFDKEGSSAAKYGYEDENSFKAAQCSKVYYVWDKATRRCELYSDADWCYPIWVWDDPYKLDRFFPLVHMQFHTDPTRLYAKGEVTYYLDQQDSLNLMNNEFSRIRGYASSILAYDKNKIKNPEVLDDILAGTYTKRTIGIDVPEGMKLGDMMGPVLPPSADAIKFFDKRATLESIDRISGVSSVQRGVEYKTNTTNRAIESYESQMQTRADEKMDAIEDSIGEVLWLVSQMCLQFMSKEEVKLLCGKSEGWEQMDPRTIPTAFSPRVAGGSSLKPTARSKKEQALQMGQILGQFARATPAAILVAIKTMQKAFNNEVVVEDEDWKMLLDGVKGALQAQQQQGAPPQQGQAQGGGSPAPEQDGPDVQNVVAEGMQRVAAFLDGMPPEVKQFIGVSLARQVPVEQIVQQVVERLNNPQG